MVNLWPQSFKCVRTDLHVWLNPNQSYRKSAVQWYFPLQVSILQVIIGQLVAVKICSNRRKTTFDKVQVHDNDAYKCYYDRDFMRPFYLTQCVTSKNLPNVYKSCPKIKWKILTPLQKIAWKCGQFGKIIFATGFEKLPKVQ